MDDDLPAPFARIHQALAAATMRHEYLGMIYRDIAGEGTAETGRRLLRRSAEIVTRDLPAMVRPIHDLEHRWLEATTLDPAQTPGIVALATEVLSRITPEMHLLDGEQDEIVSAMRTLTGRSGRS